MPPLLQQGSIPSSQQQGSIPSSQQQGSMLPCHSIPELSQSYEHAFRPEYKGGFDVVIGNPPYVLCQPSNMGESTLNYYKNFEVASYKIDLFHLFFEKSINIIKPKGMLGFITPNTYLSNKYTQKLRNFILNKTFINEIVNYNETVFVDAGVDVATLILTKENKKNETINIYDFEKEELKFVSNKSQNQWNEDSEQVFNMNCDFKINTDNCVVIDDICSVTFGLQTIDKETFVSKIKKEDDWELCYTGKDISRYSLNEASLYFKNNFELVKAGGSWDMNIHKNKKIVVRQVGNPEPIFAFDNFGYSTLNTMYSIVILDEKYNNSYLLAILNSTLIKKFWMSKYSDNKDLFPKIKGYQLKQLPIKVASKEDQISFIEKADLMLSLNKDLQDISQKFQHNLTREHAPLLNHGLPKKLQDWHLLSYADFLKELEKKKIKLSLSQKSEWESYFATESQKANTIKQQIETTDKQIDEMVYQLYGLTVDEIDIIEKG